MSELIPKNTLQTIVDIFNDVCSSDDQLETVLQRQGFNLSSENSLGLNYINGENLLFHIDTFPINNRSGINISSRIVRDEDILLKAMDLYSKHRHDYLMCLAYLVEVLGQPDNDYDELKKLSDRKHMYVPSSIWTIDGKSPRLDGMYCQGIENGVAVSVFIKYNGEIQWF